MYSICVNGEQECIRQSLSIGEFLRQRGYRINRIAVERNGGIVPRERYEQILLEEGDKLEIVSFVGGG